MLLQRLQELLLRATPSGTDANQAQPGAAPAASSSGGSSSSSSVGAGGGSLVAVRLVQMMPLWISSSSSGLEAVETAAAAAAAAVVASKCQLLDLLLPGLTGVALLLPVEDLYGLLQVGLNVSHRQITAKQ
jgi:hypothetical protein